MTIEVETRQAQKLALASSVGQLSLALRSAGSTDGSAAARIALSDLNSASSSKVVDGSRVMVTVTREINRSDYSVPRTMQ